MGHRCRVARPVGQEDSIRAMGTNRLQIRVCRQNRDITAMGDQSLEDGALDAEIDGDKA